MLKKTCKILALAALPVLLVPAAQADARHGMRINDSDGNIVQYRFRDAGKGHRDYREHGRVKHDRVHRGHKHRASHFNVSPRAYVTRDHDFGRRYRVIGHRHHHAGPLGGRLCYLW